MITDIFNMYFDGRKQTGFFKHYLTLFSVVQGLEAKNTFEFGTGLSTAVIVDALRLTGGNHISCDINDLSKTGLSSDFQHKNADIWTFYHEDSRGVHQYVDSPLDFVLHDGSHEGSVLKTDLDTILPHMKMNSYLMVHEVKHPQYGDELHDATRSVLTSVDHEISILPYGYGLAIVRINEDMGNGSVTQSWRKNKCI